MFHRSQMLLQAALLQSCRAARQCNAGCGACDSNSAFGAALRCLAAASTANCSGLVEPASPDDYSTIHCPPTLLQSACQDHPSDCSSSKLADVRGVDCSRALRTVQLASCQNAALPQLTCGLAASLLQAEASATFVQQRRWYASNAGGSGSGSTEFTASSPVGPAPPLQRAQPSHQEQARTSTAHAADDRSSGMDETSGRTSAAVPDSWLEQRCPRSLLPYAQLMRLDKPIGVLHRCDVTVGSPATSLRARQRSHLTSPSL